MSIILTRINKKRNHLGISGQNDSSTGTIKYRAKSKCLKLRFND